MSDLDVTEQSMLLRALQLEAEGKSLNEIQIILNFEFTDIQEGN